MYCRDATGKFPDYPDVDEGGSLAIFKKREEPVSENCDYRAQCTIKESFLFLISFCRKKVMRMKR